MHFYFCYLTLVRVVLNDEYHRSEISDLFIPIIKLKIYIVLSPVTLSSLSLHHSNIVHNHKAFPFCSSSISSLLSPYLLHFVLCYTNLSHITSSSLCYHQPLSDHALIILPNFGQNGYSIGDGCYRLCEFIQTTGFTYNDLQKQNEASVGFYGHYEGMNDVH